MQNQNRFLILDTETADLTGAVYDVGYTIATKKVRFFASAIGSLRKSLPMPSA